MPRTTHAIAAVLAASLLAACDRDRPADGEATPAPVAPTTEALRLPADPGARARAAVEAAMAERDIKEVPAHRHASVDLDGDGTEDLLAWLDDPNWCTPGGCTLLVFHREGDRDVLVAEVTPVKTPIAVATGMSGWRDILVTVGGDAAPVGTVALQHDGIGYPEDPMLMAALASDVVPRADVVID